MRRFNPIQPFMAWTKVATLGSAPSPRAWYGVARVGDRVIIHGGTASGLSSLNDTHVLDMGSMSWTLISTGGPKVWGHSLTPIALKRFLLVSGFGSKQIWTFDESEATWKKEDVDLPEEMAFHRAAMTETKKGVSVVCLGGRDYGSKKHPDNIAVFDME